MNQFYILLLVAGTSYRLTRLVTLDTIFDRQRQWFFNRYPPNHDRSRMVIGYSKITGTKVASLRGSNEIVKVSKWGQLVECPWCIGWWLTALVTAAVSSCVIVRLPLLVWATAATIVGLVGSKIDG